MIGLALHCPRTTDSVVYAPTGSVAYERELSTHLYKEGTFHTRYLTFTWYAQDTQYNTV